ncbi:hypothetical protein CRUP_032205, partial [Coryphaenoides rupestris]
MSVCHKVYASIFGQHRYTVIGDDAAAVLFNEVSLVGFLFLLGLYVSSLASCMGSLYGVPRILQCIAQERVIPALAFLGQQ